MKIKFLLIVLLLITFNSNAQEELINKIAAETCDCITKKNINLEDANNNDLAAVLTNCMFNSYQNHMSEFKENEKLNFSDSAQMRAFGEKVGFNMVKYCPAFILELGKKKDFLDDEEEYVEEEAPENESISGKVKSISTANYLSIKLVENSGKTTDFIILGDFDTSFLLTDKILKNNDKVQIFFYEIDLYDAKLNKFITQKIISDIIKQ